MQTQPIAFKPPGSYSSAAVPKHVVQQRFRTPKKNVPQTPIERNHFLHVIRNYVAEFNPVPPMPADELKVHADRVIGMLKCDPIYRDYIGVLINNEMWREQIASVPFERRLLLLPKCLRVESKCPAPFDEFGLLCKQCGLCTIQDLQAEAEKLGYATLVAEGSAIVMSLIQTGKIEAIVGVSCLSVLERAFPYMEAAAIPGVAIPLLQDDCIDTTVDLDWVWDYIHLTSDDQTRRLDLGARIVGGGDDQVLDHALVFRLEQRGVDLEAAHLVLAVDRDLHQARAGRTHDLQALELGLQVLDLLLHRLGLLVLGHRGKLRKLDVDFADTSFCWQLMCLRLAVILCHARRDPQYDAVSLSWKDPGHCFVLKVDPAWAQEHPQSSHLLREEIVAWQKTGWELQLQGIASSN